VLRVLALIAVVTGVAGLTAAACVLSYSSVHHLAIQAGVSGQLARLYPPILDAVLVVAGCSVLALRGAGLFSRAFSWLCLLVLLGALAAGGAVHAAAVKIPHRQAAVAAAIVPWVLVLIGFGLLVALLRYARVRKQVRANAGVAAAAVATTSTRAPGFDTVGAAARFDAVTIVAPGTDSPGIEAPGIDAIEAGTADIDRDDLGDLIPGMSRRPRATEPAAPAGSTGDAEPPTVPGAVAAAARRNVRPAELQLRARTPRGPTGGTAEVSPASALSAEPFRPRVGQQSGGQLAGVEIIGSEQAGDSEATGQKPSAQPQRAQRSAGSAGRGEGPTNPRPKDSAASELASTGELNPAPTPDTDGADSGLPAFRRTRSSPTPPEE